MVNNGDTKSSLFLKLAAGTAEDGYSCFHLQDPSDLISTLRFVEASSGESRFERVSLAKMRLPVPWPVWSHPILSDTEYSHCSGLLMVCLGSPVIWESIFLFSYFFCHFNRIWGIKR